LVTQNSVARQRRDTQAALVTQNQGIVQSDEAQVNAQKLNLVYAHIVAPIAGQIGLRLVDPGNYIQSNDPNGIAIITQLHPISVIFTLPADNLPVVSERHQTQAKLSVAAYDRAGTTELAAGLLETIDNQMDLSTATVKLRAVFDNSQGALFPNQFVNIRVQIDSLHDVTLVPAIAVQQGATGDFVYIVRGDGTVATQTVRLGPGDSRRRVIVSGLETGDQVVVDGVDSLHEGAKVVVVVSADETNAAPREPPQTQGRNRGQGGGQGRGEGGGWGGSKAAPKAGAPSTE
jgi:multidrug efflux system membrane fusion protein